MIPDLGVLLLYLALIASLAPITLYVVQRLFCYFSAKRAKQTSLIEVRAKLKSINISVEKYLRILSIGQFLLISASFLCLLFSYVNSDFSVLNVLYHSNKIQPFLYKIAASWSNHEGSMLLWTLVFSFFSCAFGVIHRGKLVISFHIINGIFSAAFLSFVILFSNPFERIFAPITSVFGLNPLLQDVGVVMHPPALYLGYIGFSVAYSATLGALLTNNIGRSWAVMIRPWVVISWSILTIGIALGSWWAYRELGWGGFWFWDPVENASIIPWILGTALLHSLLLYIKTENGRSACVILSILTFTFSMFGTFLVRSGLITSVHSFASDPYRGIIILTFVALSTIASFTIYVLKSQEENKLKSQPELLSLSATFAVQTILLSVAAFTVILGTLYPPILEAIIGRKISVGAPYFNIIFNPLIIALIYLCCFSVYVGWQNNSIRLLMQKHWPCASIAIVLCAVMMLAFKISSPLVIAAILGGLWLILTMLKLVLSSILYNTRDSKRYSSPAMILAHLGAGIVVLSIALNSWLQEEKQVMLKMYEHIEVKGFKVVLNELSYKEHKNYISKAASFNVYDKWDHFIGQANPEVRIFPIEKQQTTEASIIHGIFADIYVTIGDFIELKQALIVQVYYRPMMGWIWFGSFLMFLGGIYSVISQIGKHRVRRQNTAGK